MVLNFSLHKFIVSISRIGLPDWVGETIKTYIKTNFITNLNIRSISLDANFRPSRAIVAAAAQGGHRGAA